MEFVSNTPYTDSEFLKWVEACASHNVTLPTIDHIHKKQKDIKDLVFYQYSNEDIDKMIKEKARFNNHPTNFAVAKTELLKEKELATQKNDDEAVERISSKLADLEEKANTLDKKRSATIASISYINERNRKNNVEKAERAILAELEERKGLKTEDPFTRRSTRPKIMSKEPTRQEMASPDSQRRFEEERRSVMEQEKKSKMDEVNKKKLDEDKKREEERKRDLNNDPFAAHNFDIKIDLDGAPPGKFSSIKISVFKAINLCFFTVSSAPLAPRSLPSSTSNGLSSNGAPKRSLKFEEYKRKKGLL